MQKIIIIGVCGAGKSTLARKLGGILKLQVYHLDSLFFEPNWVERNKSDFDKDLNEILVKDAWIIDGNYGRTMPDRIEKADTIIFLDFSTPIALYRILKRRIQYHNKVREDVAANCQEKMDWEFIKFVATFREKKRPKILKRLKNLNNSKQVFIFEKDSEVEDFLTNLKT